MAPLPDRTEPELWDSARRRTAHLELLVRGDLATVAPGPIPEQVLSPQPQRGEAAPKPASAGPAAPKETGAQEPAAGEGPRATVTVPFVQVRHKYTKENGLPVNHVTAVYVDGEDAWIGTAGGGVARLNFDEKNWIVTQEEDGLASNYVTAIARYKGKIFVGTSLGISIWDGVGWATESKVGNVDLLRTSFRVHDDLLWVAARTMRGGFVTFDGEKWKDRSNLKPGNVLNNVADFDFVGKTLWIGTTNRGVFRFDESGWTTFTVADGLASNFVYTLGVNERGCYLGGCCGISAYEGGKWSIHDVAEGLSHSTVNVIAVDGGLVWFGSKKGLSLFDGYAFTNFYQENGLTDDRITALFVRDEQVWVGTPEGLNVLEKSY